MMQVFSLRLSTVQIITLWQGISTMASLFSEVSPQITHELNKSAESRFDSLGYHYHSPCFAMTFVHLRSLKATGTSLKASLALTDAAKIWQR